MSVFFMIKRWSRVVSCCRIWRYKCTFNHTAFRVFLAAFRVTCAAIYHLFAAFCVIYTAAYRVLTAFRIVRTLTLTFVHTQYLVSLCLCPEAEARPQDLALRCNDNYVQLQFRYYGMYDAGGFRGAGKTGLSSTLAMDNGTCRTA